VIALDFKTMAQKIDGKLLDDRFGSAGFKGVSIDSRTIREAELFIAIKGESNDGHEYIHNALKRKCAGLVVNHDYSNISSISTNVPVVVVNDTHRSMMRLAAAWRRRLNAKFIAVTGSNGKTTTKEFIYAMVHHKENNSYCSPGNLNNLYGLPLALFGMPSNSQYGVFELGISIPGEMTKLAGIVQPDMVVITNIGPTHLETLGTLENVAEAKFELVDSIDNDKPVLINCDDPVLIRAALKRDRDFITFGLERSADFHAERLGCSDDGLPMVKIDDCQVKIKLFGDHQVYNMLAGYAVGKVLGLDVKPDDLNEIDFNIAPYRGEIENINGLIVISDCYNANPVSMTSGLKSFAAYMNTPSLKGHRGIAVIGDMLELGEKSSEYHREIGTLLAESDFDLVFTVGVLSRDIYFSAIDNGLDKQKIKHFENTKKAGEALMTDVMRGDIIYFKASRGVELENIITLLKGAAFRQN